MMNLFENLQLIKESDKLSDEEKSHIQDRIDEGDYPQELQTYLDSGLYDFYQLNAILHAIWSRNRGHGDRVSKIAHPEYSPGKMHYINVWLYQLNIDVSDILPNDMTYNVVDVDLSPRSTCSAEKNLNCLKKAVEYAKQGFDSEQITQIYQGLLNDLNDSDISKFANVNYSAEKMKRIRYNLKDNKDNIIPDKQIEFKADNGDEFNTLEELVYDIDSFIDIIKDKFSEDKEVKWEYEDQVNDVLSQCLIKLRTSSKLRIKKLASADIEKLKELRNEIYELVDEIEHY